MKTTKGTDGPIRPLISRAAARQPLVSQMGDLVKGLNRRSSDALGLEGLIERRFGGGALTFDLRAARAA